MKKNMKLNLSELKVESFVTLLGKEKEKEVLGAANASETGAEGLCCNLASGQHPAFCADISYAGYCLPQGG